MNRKRNIFVFVIFIMLLVFINGCKLPGPTSGIIKGAVKIPPAAKELSRDITGWLPVAGAEVTIVDATGQLRTVVTDSNGNYSFTGIAVKTNTVITAKIIVDGKTIILKDVIPSAVAADQNYDAGTMDPESTALALVVEKLIKDGMKREDIDLNKIKGTAAYEDLVKEIKKLLEEEGNITTDTKVTGLVGDVIGQLATKVATVSITTDPANVSGLANDAEVDVTLSTTTSGATIYYTRNGATPTSSSTKYTSSFTVEAPGLAGGTVTVKAIGIKSGYTDSTVSSKDIIFKAKTYTVTFNSNDGSTVAPQTVNYGGKVTKPTAPTRTGYTFDAWYKESGLITLWDFANDTVTKNITLYAAWVSEAPTSFTVTYDGNGNTSGEVPVDENSPYEEEDEVTVLGQGELKKEHHIFDGWNTAADGEGDAYNEGETFEMGTENVILYAQWEAKALIVIAGTRLVTITTNYEVDVITGTQSRTFSSGGPSSEWKDVGDNLQARVITSFPSNMTNLILNPNASSNVVTISGTKNWLASVSSTTLTVEVRDKNDTNVTKSFTVVVSGSRYGSSLTIGTITVN